MDHTRTRIFIALLCIKALQASTVTFEASPAELKANLTKAVSMRCSVTDDGPSNATSSPSTAADVRHISAIFVTRNDGEDVASMTLLDAPMAFVDQGNLEVKGSISTTSGEGYLELSWRDPSMIYLGQYTCAVSAIDIRGHTVQLTSDLQLATVTPSINNVIADFNSKLNNQNMQINSKLNKQNMDIADLKRENDQLKQENARQNHTLNKLTDDIARLKACTSLEVAFTAALNTTGSFTLTGPIKYDKIILNKGGDYNVNTGNFVCSTPGIYSFHIHAESRIDQYGCLQLHVNGIAITSLYSYNSDSDGAASTGATIQLQQGDTVGVVASRTSLFHQGGSGTINYQTNIFTGYLLKGDQCST